MLGENRSKAAFSAGSKECVREEKPLFESSESFSEARKKSEHLQITPDDPAGEKTWPVAQKEEVPAEPKQSEIRKPEPKHSAPTTCFLRQKIRAGSLPLYCGRCRHTFPKSTAVW